MSSSKIYISIVILCNHFQFPAYEGEGGNQAKTAILRILQAFFHFCHIIGTFIHPDAKTNSKHDLNGAILARLNEIVDGFREEGASDSEIRIAFTNDMNFDVYSAAVTD